MPRSPREGLCAYCGKRGAITRDHCPPKSVLLKPLPNDVITGPQCYACKTLYGDADEESAVYLSMFIQTDTANKLRHWNERALRMAAGNQRLTREVLSRLRKVPMTTPGGLYVEMGTRSWNRRRHDDFMIRITRGLYFAKYAPLRLNALTQFRVVVESQEPAAFNVVADVIQKASPGYFSIGKNQFQCFHVRDPVAPEDSIWIYGFHGGHATAVYTRALVIPGFATTQVGDACPIGSDHAGQ